MAVGLNSGGKWQRQRQRLMLGSSWQLAVKALED